MKKKFVYIMFLLLISITFRSVALDKKFSDTNYMSIVVSSGDTLWSISKMYAPKDQDIRKFIYELKVINDKEDSIIKPGDVLLIPIE